MLNKFLAFRSLGSKPPNDVDLNRRETSRDFGATANRILPPHRGYAFGGDARISISLSAWLIALAAIAACPKATEICERD